MTSWLAKFERAAHALRRSALRAVLVPLAVATLAACSSDEAPQYVEQPVEQLYNQGMDQLERGRYTQAAQLFDEVDRQHPYSVWASKAQLMSAYAYYQDNGYDDAINTLDRFIQLHPGNRDIAYAYYLKAISYYEQISQVERDQKMTALALESLEEVVRRFPESRYARDARLKIDLALDHMAGKETAIGRFYQSRGHHLAAINRFRTVIEKYQTTTHVAEALHRLVECHLAIGLTQEAYRTAAVLGHNYPGSEWYADSYALLQDLGIQLEDEPNSTVARARQPQ